MKKVLSLLSAAAVLSLNQVPTASADIPAACTHLTPQAFSELNRTLERAKSLAIASCPTAGCGANYVPQYMIDAVVAAQTSLSTFTTALAATPYGTPYITNASISDGVYGTAWDMIPLLYRARYYSMLSSIYDRHPASRQAFDAITHAIDQTEVLGLHGGKCYVDQYGPFTTPF